MLIELLSPERLNSYGLGTAPESLVIKRYEWNIALSESLYPALSLLEIGLRNRMDAALINVYGSQWLNGNCPCWIRTPSMIRQGLPNPEQDAIARAKQKLLSENGQWHHAKLIAELNFGFWTNLFKTYYHPVIWQQKQKPLKDVFREFPKISAKQAYNLLSTIRVLRNRIAHHEAIW
nr:Abi family protein [Aetokthonos hydrillicola Thurmond2011]